MSETYGNMYGDDDDLVPSPVDQQSIGLQQRGMFTEMEINGKKVSIVDVAVIARLENTIKTLQSRVSKLENDLRNVTSRLSNAERSNKAMALELDNKVSYE